MNQNNEPASEGAELAFERYMKMTEGDKPVQTDDLPALAEKRQEEAQEMASRVIGAARALVSKGMLQAVGYRLLIKPIESTMGLEEAEMETAPTLAQAGFVAKSVNQIEREERGENHGVIISMGPVAFDRMGGREAWADEGDVVVFSRYAGTRVEHPPGSGTFYQLMNDEDIFGKMI